MEYVAGVVEIGVSDRWAPIVYLPGLDGIAIEQIADTLPALNALLSDPCVTAARERAKAEGLPAGMEGIHTPPRAPWLITTGRLITRV